ncbi:TetR/AcrR family transcriptional regulator [Actinospica durhamensis]|uniref:TetR/AcrR family transcriptional regulator n=1 Tax=Actinospica durhamensis TaxID=1508375 RepID=A0A941IKU1_9ACTN|nr:TetR/AcrR family transcriptional regulator [Actinospica durhamensis]MBR7832230.1 TetR/AcrR family transcriptional regulator [Actinospica durhamensis]
MARPRNEVRRLAILSAATHVIASQGIGAASTAVIAKGAGVSNGSLFTYFDTKTQLLNELYVELKSEMAQAATADLPPHATAREQVRHMWRHWARWATDNPAKRRVLAQLQVADEITAESHQQVAAASASIADLLERARVGGPVQDAALGFVLTLANALAEAAIDEMIRDPEHAAANADTAFEALWRVLAGAIPPTDT